VKILGISGSLRQTSHNTQLLRVAADLLPPGTELEIFDGLDEVPPFNEDDERTPPPGVVRLKDAIAAADAVLIATPEYNHSIPGVLKNAFDWVSRPIADNPMRGKPALVIGASTGMFGAVWAQAETRKVLGALGARVLDEELPVAKAPEGLDDHELLAQLADLLGDLVSSGEALMRAA